MAFLLEQSLVAVHQLSTAAWFGALVYRLFFVDPKWQRYFGSNSDQERFALHLADGMRGVVLAALLICGLSGFTLLGLRWTNSSAWLTLMGVKTFLWLGAFALFGYISWVFWPRRLFAIESEYQPLRGQGIVLAMAMIAFAGLGIVLGQLGQALRFSLA